MCCKNCLMTSRYTRYTSVVLVTSTNCDTTGFSGKTLSEMWLYRYHYACKLPSFLTEFPKIFTHYSILSPIIPSNFYIVSMTIMSTMHYGEYYTREQGVCSVLSFRISIATFMFTIIIILNNLKDYFITIGHSSRLFLYCAHEYPIIPMAYYLWHIRLNLVITINNII